MKKLLTHIVAAESHWTLIEPLLADDCNSVVGLHRSTVIAWLIDTYSTVPVDDTRVIPIAAHGQPNDDDWVLHDGRYHRMTTPDGSEIRGPEEALQYLRERRQMRVNRAPAGGVE